MSADTFVQALRQEYLQGGGQAVGAFFDQNGDNPQFEQMEDFVRNAPDKASAINEIANQLGVGGGGGGGGHHGRHGSHGHHGRHGDHGGHGGKSGAGGMLGGKMGLAAAALGGAGLGAAAGAAAMGMMGGGLGGKNQQTAGPPQQQTMATNLQQVDPYKVLEELEEVHIIEKMNMMETASGLLGEIYGVDLELEMANKYLVSTSDGHPLFFAVEQTDFLNRQAVNCCGDCRAIDIDVVVLGQDPRLMDQATGNFDWSFNPFTSGVDLSGSQKFLRMHKEAGFTCCCFNRPVIEVRDGSTDDLLGRIRDPWHCCDMTFDLEGPDEESIMRAKGGCCQLGYLCPCPCGPCKEVHFGVMDAKGGEDVGSLKKVVPDFMKFIVADDVDNYEVDFGTAADPKWKAMMIALGLFIDFRYFNVRSDKNDRVRDGAKRAFGGRRSSSSSGSDSDY